MQKSSSGGGGFDEFAMFSRRQTSCLSVVFAIWSDLPVCQGGGGGGGGLRSINRPINFFFFGGGYKGKFICQLQYTPSFGDRLTT